MQHTYQSKYVNRGNEHLTEALQRQLKLSPYCTPGYSPHIALQATARGPLQLLFCSEAMLFSCVFVVRLCLTCVPLLHATLHAIVTLVSSTCWGQPEITIMHGVSSTIVQL